MMGWEYVVVLCHTHEIICLKLATNSSLKDIKGLQMPNGLYCRFFKNCYALLSYIPSSFCADLTHTMSFKLPKSNQWINVHDILIWLLLC